MGEVKCFIWGLFVNYVKYLNLINDSYLNLKKIKKFIINIKIYIKIYLKSQNLKKKMKL